MNAPTAAPAAPTAATDDPTLGRADDAVWIDLAECRSRIETVNSQLAVMGVQRLHARTNEGIELKICASLLALVCKNKRAA